jgi:hypothetical protein
MDIFPILNVEDLLLKQEKTGCPNGVKSRHLTSHKTALDGWEWFLPRVSFGSFYR